MLNSKPPPPRVVGGFFFFFSLISLLIIGLVALSVLPLIITAQSVNAWWRFALGFFVGILSAHLLIRGRLAVFIHELKHSIVSNLVGNRAKGMKIRSSSGHFEYEYTRETSRFNAFISLAPYYLPLATLSCLALALIQWHHNHLLLVLCTGIGYGIDTSLNIRDISPHQTDFSLIRGGFKVGLTYVIAIQLFMFSLLAAWVSAELHGLALLAKALWAVALFIALRGHTAS